MAPEDNATDTSKTVSRKRERAPAEGAMDSVVSSRTPGKRCRVGDLHVAFAVEEEVVKERAQWRHPEMKSKMDAQSRLDPAESFVVDGVGARTPVWVAEEGNRIRG